MLQVEMYLHHQLGTEYQRHRKRRHPEDPHNYFVVPIKIHDGSKWHRLWAIVDDVLAEGKLFVMDVVPQ
jgi:hypothetical protein